MPDCEFCLVSQDPARVHLVHQDERTLAFLDDHPAADGHTLVIPRRHSRNLLDVDDADASAVMATAARIARTLDRELHPDGFTVLQNNEEAAWQGTFHLHVHVIPRWENDELYSPWEPRPGNDQELHNLAQRLAASTQSLEAS